MKGFIAPKFTKEDVRQLLTKKDKKQILINLGYTLIPKEQKFVINNNLNNTNTNYKDMFQEKKSPTVDDFNDSSMQKIDNEFHNLEDISCRIYTINLNNVKDCRLKNIA